jgi:hypothetical protein
MSTDTIDAIHSVDSVKILQKVSLFESFGLTLGGLLPTF